MARAGTYRVETGGTPARLGRRRNVSALVVAVAVGLAGAVLDRVTSGVAELVALAVVAAAVAYVLRRFVLAPVSPHLILDPDEHAQVDALLARGGGPVSVELREALAAGRLTAAQVGHLRDVLHAEAERLYAVIDDRSVETPDGLLEEWQDLERVERRVARVG